MKMVKFTPILLLVSLFSGFQATSLKAGSYTWATTSNATQSWTTTTVWTPTAPAGGPGSGDDVVLSGAVASATLTLNSTVSINSLAFKNSANNNALYIQDGGSITLSNTTLGGNGTGSLYIQNRTQGNAASIFNGNGTIGALHVFSSNSSTTGYFTTQSGQNLSLGVVYVGTTGASNGGGMFTIGAGSTVSVTTSGGMLLRGGSIGVNSTVNLNGTLKFGNGTNGAGALTRTLTPGSAVLNFNSGAKIANNGTGNITFSSTDTNSTPLDVALGSGTSHTIDINGSATQNLTLQSSARLIDQSGVSGGWTKTGIGQVVLQGNNTYTGDTVVSDGTLVLDTTGSLAFKIGANGVNNKLYDDAGTDGKISLNGKFVFDLSGANTTVGNSWTIVDLASFSSSSTFFGGNFTVASLSGNFTHAGNLWTQSIAGSTYYQFSEATGQLTVVPEPATWMLLAAGLTVVVVFRRRRTA